MDESLYFTIMGISFGLFFTFIVCGIICTRMQRRKRAALFSTPVVVTSQQPAHAVQFQAGPANTFQPNPSAPYPQNMQIHMPMPPYPNNQQFQQPYQNVYPQQPPPYPGIPQQQDNQGGFKIGVEALSSTTVGRNHEESRTTVARY